jgi:hypothetical protein
MEQKLNLGQIIIGPKERDATHIAVLPVVAAEDMVAGNHVGLNKKGEACLSAPHIGIVDPFLKTRVLKGDKFWLFMYPNTITSLRHEWDHPILAKIAKSKAEDEKSESIEWLKNYAIREVYDNDYYQDRDKAYEAMLDQVRSHELTFYGTDCHGYGDVPDAEELFKHLSIVLDMHIDRAYFEDRGYFSCSC